MRRVFATICPIEDQSYLTDGIFTELFYAPLYEHAYKKIENAVKALDLEAEVVRASSCQLPNTLQEISAGLEDVVIFASPFVFLAEGSDVEGAIDYVVKSDLGYATVGTQRSLYMAVGLGKMVSQNSIGTPLEFISAINASGAVCPSANFADGEASAPRNRLDYFQRVEKYRQEYIDYLIRFGANIEARDGIVISPTVTVENNAKILTGCHIYGSSIIGKGAIVGPNAYIRSSKVLDNSIVKASTVELSTVEKDVYVSEGCVIKEGSHLLSGVRIEPFCELASSTVSADTKISSHSHIWDSEIGARVIIGSSVVTINYETNRKNSKCVIGDGAIIGCNSNLVLPINIGAGSFVAAGSTITDDVPTGALAIAREYQTNRTGWAVRRKNYGKHI